MSQVSIKPDHLVELTSAWARAYGQGRVPTQLSGPIAPSALMSRGAADALAAWQRWHDTNEDARFTPTEWSWYALLERARVETLASHHLPGIANNLADPLATLPTQPAMAQLYQAARQIFSGQTNVASILLKRPKETGEKGEVRSWLERLLPSWPTTGPAPSEPPEPTPQLNDANVIDALSTAAKVLEDAPCFAETLHPLIRKLADYYSDNSQVGHAENPAQVEGDTEASDTVSEDEDPEGQIELDPAKNQEFDRIDVRQGYAVFTRAWDEQHPASHWYRHDDAAALKGINSLDRLRVKQLAHRLQRRLMAARLRHWSFDQEQGRLDSRRLSRLVGGTIDHRIFRIENEAPAPEACVTLLVDQSGSMRGARQQMAVLAIDLAVHTLELCQVRCEVLGYTTRFSEDNPVKELWQRRGSPSAPGRLNALRHILYKSTDQPWRRARPHLGLMLREGFGHENIDGEALHWAARRLAQKSQSRKILVVLSDGAPYDAATAATNGREFLENHLRVVINEIEASQIHLAAIGTGQDVGRYYRQSVTVRRPEAVAETLFERLGDLLTLAHSPEETP